MFAPSDTIPVPASCDGLEEHSDAASERLEGLLRQPYAGRQAASQLRAQIVEYLRTVRPSAGQRFLTEAELVRLSSLSRSTVRRALAPLQQQGLIRRRAGSGTFVGGRFGDGESLPSDNAVRGDGRRLVRVAVLIFSIGDLAHDWYTPMVLDGIDRAAEEQGLSVELLGNRDRDIDAISRRLQQSRPDVLVCLAPEPKQAFVIRDAQKLGVRCVVTGTPHIELGIPAVCEDNRDGTRRAVEHLLAQGHRRIGLILERRVQRWVYERHEAFLSTLTAAGAGDEEASVCWLPMSSAASATPEALDAVRRFLRQKRPTAVVSAGGVAMDCLDRLHGAGEVRVPEDLSVVTFEQKPVSGAWFGGREATTVALPLTEMGRHVARYARQLADGGAVPAETQLPCGLAQGRTVLRLT